MQQSRTTGKKTKRVVAITIVGMLVYFFSSGPAAYLVRREILADKLFRFVYTPLAFFEEWRPYVTYMRWWYNTKAERVWIEAEEQWTATQWLKHAVEELQKRGAPSPELIHSLPPGDWVGGGYLAFSNGWASFTSHSSHDSEKIGNIGLLRTSDGDFYVNNFHFCMGLAEFQGPNKIQPKDFSHFLELYGVQQKWRKKP